MNFHIEMHRKTLVSMMRWELAPANANELCFHLIAAENFIVDTKRPDENKRDVRFDCDG